MSHEISDINELPNIEDIRKASQSLAMLDLILVQEWEYRYFSFNSIWDSGEMMASMRNGEGDEYFILFSKNGIAGKIFLKDIEITQSQDVLQMIPEEFNSYEEAVEFWEVHDTTDYPDAFQTIEVEDAELRQRHYEVEIDPDLIEVLRERARKNGIPVSRLISNMLRQHMRSAA